MSHNLTPVSQYTGNVTVPDNGDARTAESVNVALQSLADRALYAFDQLVNGVLVGGDVVDSSDGDTLNVTDFSVIIANKLYAKAASAVTVSVLEGGGAFANFTVYYLYAYVSAGAILFQISVTAPDTKRVFKSGTTTHRYLCTFATNGSADILPFQKRGNKYTFRQSKLNAFLVLLSGAATSYTDVDCNVSQKLVPLHAKVATIRALYNNTDAATQNIDFRTDGDTTNTIQAFVTNGITYAESFDIEVTSTGTSAAPVQKFEYKSTDAQLDVSIWVTGWFE